MTITATDFESEIDAAPRGDASVRFAYADWLEEQGDAAGARFQRWMGETGRGPFRLYAHWRWCEGSDYLISAIPTHLLSADTLANFHTRIAAESALRTALERVSYEVTW